MQLATARLDDRTAAVGVDPVRGVVELSRLSAPLPASVPEVLAAVSPQEFTSRLAAEPDASFRPAADAVFLAPYRHPRLIWGIGLNYTDHADDLDAVYPDEPASFVKGDHTVIGPGEVIELPAQSLRVTAEAELCLVMGSACRNVEPESALDYVWGACPVLDQTAEDILQRNPRFLTRSKNFPGFFSFGPGITPLPEVLARFGSLGEIEVTTAKNGSPHRANKVANMIFSPELLVSFHSKVFPWQPGDLLSTGTPGAVVIEDGDTAECHIPGIGSLFEPGAPRVTAWLDEGLVRQAAALAAADGEFGLMAAGWTGAVVLASGESAWRIPLEGGRPGEVSAPESAPGAAPAKDLVPTQDSVLIAAEPAAWSEFLAADAVPPYSDLFGAQRGGRVSVTPLLETAARHNAVRRLGWLLRQAAGLAERPYAEPRRAPGEHDDAVGRYMHLAVDGTPYRVYYESAGEGVPLLCQHTAAADARQWRHLLEDRRVTSRFRVIAYDLPYHGRSLPGGDNWWEREYVLTRELAMGLVTGLSGALGLDRPVFAGSSIGGMLALDLARYHPDEFRAVIALQGGLRASGGLTPEGEVRMRRFRVDERLADPALQAARQSGMMSPAAPEAGRQETMLHYAQSAPGVYAGDLYFHAIDHDLRGEADKIDTARCPVHLLTGEFDHTMVPISERAAAEIPGAELTIMRGLGHFPMSEDHEQLMEYLLPVLARYA